MAEANWRVTNDYISAKNWELAIKACLEGMNLDPDDENLLMQFGFIQMQMRNFGLGKHIFSLLKNKNPADFAILHNLGLAELSVAPYSGEEKFLGQAEEHLRKALKKTPGAPQTLNGIAQVYLHRGNWQACIEYCEKSLAINPEQPALQETFGMASLALGRFGEGFKGLDQHIPSLTRKPKPKGSEPYWDGAKGKKLFVQGEQGIGDEISFASVIFDAVKENDIVLECDPRLGGLFKRSLPVRVEATRNVSRDWDFEPDAMCLSGTLATHYRKSPEDFPRKAFLQADPERRAQWRTLLDKLPGKKVGIAWKGGVPMNFSGRRSVNLSQLHPLLNQPGITWISLEYKNPEDEIKAYERKNNARIVHWERAVGKGVDYDETAALVMELDSVVSVCTSVVHLCGALGKECHVLVPKVPRWFYESKDKNHYWYDSLILHREDKGWPLETIAKSLCESPSTPTTLNTPLLAFAV